MKETVCSIILGMSTPTKSKKQYFYKKLSEAFFDKAASIFLIVFICHYWGQKIYTYIIFFEDNSLRNGKSPKLNFWKYGLKKVRFTK